MLKWLSPGVELMNDVSPADWVVERLRPFAPNGARLDSFAPDGFDAYVRVFHPAGYRPAARGSLDPGRATRWADLASARGVTLSPDISFSEVTGINREVDRALDELEPTEDHLPPETCDALVALLTPHTRTPERCWFCALGGKRVLLERIPWDGVAG